MIIQIDKLVKSFAMIIILMMENVVIGNVNLYININGLVFVLNHNVKFVRISRFGIHFQIN